MDQIPDAIILLGGLILGLAAGYLLTRTAAASLRSHSSDLQERLDRASDELVRTKEIRASIEAAAESERNSFKAQLKLLENAKAELSDAFSAISARALSANTRSFFDVANSKFSDLINPVSAALKTVEAHIRELESKRESAYGEVRQYLDTMKTSQQELRQETAGLVRALRSPGARGRWGEVQLRRVIELAGMINHCDFFEQKTLITDSATMRPDVIVRLPSGRSVVVDAKVPLEAYLDACESTDETERTSKLKLHARQVRAHIGNLKNKSYYQAVQPAPEFVVLFLPSEVFYSAALEQDPSLIEHGADEGVMIATPTTLIALLKAVAFGWNQEKLAQNAQAVSDLGRDIHERLVVVCEHLEELGRRISQTVESYNRTIGSMESRVLVSARKFKELGAASENDVIPDLNEVDREPRRLQASILDEAALQKFSILSTDVRQDDVETK
ncbi:MAG TPA: DNA recombination protein RmuC [Terriglobia bacterium]|nr:DNA recombination protein RmuC [Terriglobia bacterium]